jgi:hypothetical protein
LDPGSIPGISTIVIFLHTALFVFFALEYDRVMQKRAIATACVVVPLIVLGIAFMAWSAFFSGKDGGSVENGVWESDASSKESAEQSASLRAGEDMHADDAERTGLEDKQLPAEDLAHMRRMTAVAQEALQHAPVGSAVKHYRNDDLGIDFSYPADWGDLSVSVHTSENSPYVRRGFEVLGSFSAKPTIRIGSISADFEDVPGGRGLSTAEVIVRLEMDDVLSGKSDAPVPDISNDLGEHALYAWYAWPVGWETDDFVFAIRAPVRRSDIRDIAFVGPLANDSETSEADVRGVMLIVQTYRVDR